MFDHFNIDSLMQCKGCLTKLVTIWLLMAFGRSFLQTYNLLCTYICTQADTDTHVYTHQIDNIPIELSKFSQHSQHTGQIHQELH